VAAFETAIRGAPGWWVPYRGKAVAQAASGDLAAATLTLEAGFQATRQALPLGSDLAAVYERTGQVDKAVATYEKLQGAAPENARIANNLAMLLATHRDDRASLDRALALTESFADSDVAPFLDTRGWVLYRLGRTDEAVALLRRAVELQPESPLNRYHLAMALVKAGEKDEARRNLEAALASGVRFPGHDDARTALEALRRT
jgi:Flp pilus assembly protein TadD